jgi:hypothetical protein
MDLSELRTAGWLIGVMVEARGDRGPTRRFYAIGQPDRARAEWKAVDHAMAEGAVASSPVGGLEPVHAVTPLSVHRMRLLGLRADAVQALGSRWPRWLPHTTRED